MLRLPRSHEDEGLRLLSVVDLFEELSPEELERLDWRPSVGRMARGETIYNPDDASGRLYILHSGLVRIYKASGNGRELTVSVVHPGSLFGEAALAGHGAQDCYAQTLAPSEVSVLHREELERLLLDEPRLGLRLTRLLSERLRSRETRMCEIGLMDVPARLASLILTLLDTEGVMSAQGLKIPTHYTHQQMGTMIGANREAVTKAFSRLQERGAVELVSRHIYVRDIEALSAAVG